MEWYQSLITFVIYAVVIIAGIGIPLKIMMNSQYFKGKAEAKKIEAKQKTPNSSFVAQARDLIETAPQKLAQIDKELAFLQEKGATEEQMANLKMERNIVQIANNPFAKMLGEPIIDLAVQTANKFGLRLK